MCFVINRSLLGFVLLAIASSAKPISRDAAKYAAIAGGAAVAVGTGVLTHKSLTSLHDFHNQARPVLVSSAIGLAAGGATWYHLYKWLYSLTPEGQVIKLNDIIQKNAEIVQAITFDPLSSIFTDNDVLIASLIARFDKFSWPLILGKDLLSANIKQLNQILQELSKLQPELEKNENHKTLVQDCSQLIQKIMVVSSTLQKNLILIINHEKYDFQAQLYEQVNGAERLLRLQAQEGSERRRQQDKILEQNRYRPISLNLG